MGKDFPFPLSGIYQRLFAVLDKAIGRYTAQCLPLPSSVPCTMRARAKDYSPHFFSWHHLGLALFIVIEPAGPAARFMGGKHVKLIKPY